MYNEDSSPTVTGCFFSGNNAKFGGGIYNSYFFPGVVNCVFSKNYASNKGGGMYNWYSSPTVVNCTFSRNSAESRGGGIHNAGSDPNLTNCIVWGNDAPTGPEIYNDWSNPTVSYCDIDQDGYTDNNNIRLDPKFIDAVDTDGSDDVLGTTDDGLFLRTDSPCIDTGYNQAIEDEGVTTDIIGNPRKIDGDHNDTVIVDMGAYELPTIWYVDDNVQGGNYDGTSWENAYDQLRDALTDPNIKDGDEIWVADCTYEPTEDSNRAISFKLVEGVGVYGGFSGNETARIDRDWTSYEAILSGDINVPDVNTDNSYHVVKGTDRAVLDGFTITGGYDDWGAGIYCYETSPIISNCTIADNYSIGDGGGIYCYRASLQISDCVIVDNNSSDHGGGMCNDGGPYYEDIRFPTVTNCFFIGNSSGMVNYYCCGWQMLITNCVFSGNDYYGIFNYDASSPTLTNCTFAKNFTGMTNGLSSNPTVINCIFWANTDGEIYNRFYSNPTFSYCDINDCYIDGVWDSSLGIDDGNNIDSDPCFVDINNPAGPDANFGTWDDGLRLDYNSPCINTGDNNAVPSGITTDIKGDERIMGGVVDMGAYESGARVVVMCWIDEANPGYYWWGHAQYNTDLAGYRNVVKSDKLFVVRSGCLVPGRPVAGVLPDACDPPPEISVEDCNRQPDLNEFIDDFNRIRDGVVPDYLILIVDNSGSMTTATIEPAYSEADPNFIGWIKTNYPGTTIKRRDVGPPDPDAFINERWVDEMRIQVQNVIYGL